MNQLVRTDSENTDFKQLVHLLDADLKKRDGEDHVFYNQFNSIDSLKHTVVLYHNKKAISCGAIKQFDTDVVEVKRMYILPEFRGKGLSSLVLTELENWAGELGNNKCILETGKRQPEAIRFYEKNGYKTIDNYGQYVGVENSVCFEKSLLKFNKK